MGQKTNPNIFRLGVNKKWKTEFFEKKTKEFSYFTYTDLEIKSYIERFLNIYGLILHDYKIHHTNSVLNIYISYAVTPDFKFNNLKQEKKLKLVNKTKQQNFFYLNTNQKIKKDNAAFLKIKDYLKHSVNDLKELNTNPITIPQTTDTVESTKHNNLKNLKIENKIQKLIKGLELFKNSRVSVNFKCINKTFNLTMKQKKSLKKKIMLLQKFRYTPFFKEGVNLMFLSVYKRNSSKLLAKFIEIQLKKIKRHKFFMTFLKKTLTLFLNSNFSKVKGVRIKVKGRLNGAPRAKHKILDVGDIPVQTIDSILDYSETTIHNSNGSYGIKVWVIEKNKNITE